MRSIPSWWEDCFPLWDCLVFSNLLCVKLSSTKFIGLILTRRMKVKNQIEILKELIREIVGSISVEELFKNRNVSELAEELLKSLNLNSYQA